MITSELRAFLLTRSFVGAGAGQVTAKNVVLAPADLTNIDFSIMTFEQEEAPREPGLDGQPIDLVQAIIRYQCAGKSPENAIVLANSVIDDLAGYRGVIGSRYCVLSTIETASDGADPDTGAHVALINHTIWHRPA